MSSASYSLRMLGEQDTYDADALRAAEDAINRSQGSVVHSHHRPAALSSTTPAGGDPDANPFDFAAPSSSLSASGAASSARMRRTPSIIASIMQPGDRVDEEEVLASADDEGEDDEEEQQHQVAGPPRIPTPGAPEAHGTDLWSPPGAVHSGAFSHDGGGGDNTDSDPEFDITEDIFAPIQQIRLRRKRWKKKMKFSKRCVAEAVTSSVPALHWLPRYVLKRDLLSDVIAGVMLSVVSVPQGMAYALLGGLSPIYGLYSCLIPTLVYAFLGCSRTMHIGPVAVMCLLLGNAVTDVAPTGANMAYKEDLAILLSIMVGLVLLATSLLRLGFAVSFLSDSVLGAYNCASAFLIFTSQLGSFIGIKVPPGYGFVETFAYLFANIADANLAAFLMGSATVLLILFIDHMNLKYKPRIPVPAQLVAVVFGTILSSAFDMHNKFGLAIIGTIPTGLPMPTFPGSNTEKYKILLPDGSVDQEAAPLTLLNVGQLRALVQPAAMLALISYVISISIAKDFAIRDNDKRAKAQKEAEAAAQAGQEPPASVPGSVTVEEEVVIDANQELFALGVSNLLGGFVQAIPVGGALSRTVLVYNAGIRTSMGMVFSVVVLMFVLLVLTPLLYALPFTVLAAIVFTALKSLLLQVKESKRLFNLRRQDFLMWTFTFSCTLLFDTQTGIAAGLITSLLMLLKNTSRPPSATLGRLPHTDMYRDVKFHPLAHSYRGVLVFRWDAPLHFANAAYFKMQLVKHMRRAAARDFQQHRTDVPDQSDDGGAGASSGGAPSARGSRLGIDEIHRRLKVRWGHMGSLMQQTADKLRGRGSRSRRGLSTVQLAEEVDMRATQVHEAANMDQALAVDKTDEALAQELAATGSGSSSSVLLPAAPAAPLTLHDCRIRYVVIDCTSIVEVDDTALKMLMALAGQLQVQLAFCMLNSRMRDLLGRVHLFHAAALAAIDMQQHHPPVGSTPSAAGGQHQHRISMSDLSATGLEEEIGLARPWASVHQAVKYVVEHMRLQGLKAAAAAAAAAAAQQGSSSLPTTPTQQSTSIVVTRAGDSDGAVVTNENGGAAGGSGGALSPSPPPQQQQQKQPKQKRAAASASASASPPASSSSSSSPGPSSTPPVVVSSPSGSRSPSAPRPAS